MNQIHSAQTLQLFNFQSKRPVNTNCGFFQIWRKVEPDFHLSKMKALLFIWWWQFCWSTKSCMFAKSPTFSFNDLLVVLFWNPCFFTYSHLNLTLSYANGLSCLICSEIFFFPSKFKIFIAIQECWWYLDLLQPYVCVSPQQTLKRQTIHIFNTVLCSNVQTSPNNIV